MPNGGLAISSAHLPSSSGSGFEFPVGHVLIDTTGTDPATYLGYGTWAKIGAGRVLIGQDTGDGDFDTLLETGGAKTVAAAGSVAAPTISGSTAAESSHTHSVTSNVAVAAHTFTQPTISWPAGVPTFAGNALSGHQHELPFQMPSGTVVRSISSAAFGTGTSRAATSTASFASNSASAAVAMSESVSAGTPSGTMSWPAGVPTNASGAVDAHSVTNNAVTSGAGSSHSHGAGTLAASAPGFTGSATSVVQPYLVVCFWKRTA